MWFQLVKRHCELNTRIFGRIWHHLAMSKVLQWTELSLIFFAQAAADIESRALLGLIILSLCLDKSTKIQWLPAHAVFKCFQLVLSICSKHFLKTNLIANASAGSAGHGGAALAAVVVVITLFWLFIVLFPPVVVVVVVVAVVVVVVVVAASSSHIFTHFW